MQQTPFKPFNAFTRWPYAFAVLAFLLAYAARYYLFPLQAGVAYTTFYPAIIVSFLFFRV